MSINELNELMVPLGTEDMHIKRFQDVFSRRFVGSISYLWKTGRRF